MSGSLYGTIIIHETSTCSRKKVAQLSRQFTQLPKPLPRQQLDRVAVKLSCCISGTLMFTTVLVSLIST